MMKEVIKSKRETRNAEIEQMRKLGLFSDTEINKIRLKREFYDGTLNKSIKCVDDFADYIKHEKKLLDLINERIKTREITESPAELIHGLCKKIHILYNAAISQFPERLRLWDAYMVFSRQYKYKEEVSLSLKRMLNIHAHNPEAWMRAISWECEDMQNIVIARKYFLCALQKNPESHLLFTNYVKMELKEGAQVPDWNKHDRDLALHRSTLVYEMAKKKINDIKFFIELLSMVQDFPFTDTLIETIIHDMEIVFPRKELLWHTLAQRELMGFHRHYKNESKDSDDYDKDEETTPNNLPRKKKLRARIEICVQVYEVATEELKTDTMWSYYIKEMMALNQDLSTEKNLKRNSLMKAFKGAHDAGLMTVDQYLDFLEILMQSEENEYFLTVIRAATTKHTYAIKLWETWMRFHIRNDEEEQVNEIFKRATKKLATGSVPLWRLLIHYYHTKPDIPDKLDEIYRAAIYQSPTISSFFKPVYIEWVASNRNINFARKTYNELSTKGAPCLALHKAMLGLESMQIKPDMEEWRECHENTVTQFGECLTEVWLSYITFERDHGIPKNIGVIFQRAKSKLKAEFIDHFISEFKLIMSEYEDLAGM